MFWIGPDRWSDRQRSGTTPAASNRLSLEGYRLGEVAVRFGLTRSSSRRDTRHQDM